MPVKGVIFDVSHTLINETTLVVPNGIRPLLERLHNLGIQIIAAHNNGPRSHVQKLLATAGIVVDHVVTSNEVGKKKGSDVWIRYIEKVTGLRTNELLYVGDSRQDVITATRGPVIYMHAEWTKNPWEYGIRAPNPEWVGTVIEHIFQKEHNWWWELDSTDANGNRVRARALTNAGLKEANRKLYNQLLDVFKRDDKRTVGHVLIRDFAMLHLLASLYFDGVLFEADLWTTYPGHEGKTSKEMASFLKYAAKLFRRAYHDDVFIRHTPAMHSVDARNQGGIALATQNQMDTIHLNPEHADKVAGKKVLLFDDNITDGVTMDVARNMLLKAGAADVQIVAIGKYSNKYQVISITEDILGNWDPFSPSPQYDETGHKYKTIRVPVDHDALANFLASYTAIENDAW